jgi:hypothetical protein
MDAIISTKNTRPLGASLAVMFAGVALGSRLFVGSAVAEAPVADSHAAPAQRPVQAVEPAVRAERAAWRSRLIAKGLPKAGCFSAIYPNTAWTETACTPVAHFKRYPRITPIPIQIQPPTVAGGYNVGAQVTANSITSAEGTFPQVIDVSSIATGNATGTGVFSLQLNTNTFTVAGCTIPGTTASCVGWVQFVVQTGPERSVPFIEYWLVGYGDSCPGTGNNPNWANSPPGAVWTSDGPSCYYEVQSGPAIPPITVGDLSSLSVRGIAGTQSLDQIVVTLPDGSLRGQSAVDQFFKLVSNWRTAQFNVYGSNGGREAFFNPGAALVVQLQVNYGSIAAPTLTSTNDTGETNNLIVGLPGCSTSGNPPFIQFEEVSEASQLSGQCPPAPRPLPPLSCTELATAVTEAKVLLADATKQSASCPGLKVTCLKTVQTDTALLDQAQRQYDSRCATK